MDNNENKRNEKNTDKEKDLNKDNIKKEETKKEEQKQDKNISKENNTNDEKKQDENANNNGEVKEEKSELDIQIEKTKEAEDKYIRLFAEFQNFRNRSEKEKSDMYDIGVSSAVLKFLPVVDNIERALENIPEDLKTNAFVDGVDKVYKQILKTFEELQIKPIDAKGKMFDPNFHNAVMTDEESDAEVDTITDVMLKGYTYKDQVLRHSMVKVKK